jgi:uncharacterized coiled-coil protein SlyX
MRGQVAELKEMLAERELVIEGQKARLEALRFEPEDAEPEVCQVS